MQTDVYQGLNATVSTQGTAVNMDAGCTMPPKINLDTANSNNYTVTATDTDGCTAIASFNPGSADQQYGTSSTDPATCGLDPNTSIDFVPIMFWFFHIPDHGDPQASAVICRPTLELFNVDVEVNANNNSLNSVQILNNYTLANNITGSPLNGKPYNACVVTSIKRLSCTKTLCRVLFSSSNSNEFVKARAVAIQSQIPGAIFRVASERFDIDQFFGTPRFLPLTKTIYVRVSL